MTTKMEMEIDETSPITTEMLDKWRSYVQAFPLPQHLIPTGDHPLARVDDDALLNAPPHLIAHVQRTACQKGVQVVSPRQCPFSSLMVRKDANLFELGDHEVGSIADEDAYWPTLDDSTEELERLLPDAPVAPMKMEQTVRPKTRTVSLTKGHHLLNDPVLACLVKGRAVIDIMKRDDVGGGWEEMVELLAKAWGVDEDDIMELDAYSLGFEGDLQRHAIRTDDVYPMLYAPINERSVISMGVSDLNKSLLLPYTGLDWRRMRVFCEAVFYNCCNVEGVPLRQYRAGSYPGSSSNPHSRENMLVFTVAPGAAWTFAPETFSVIPIASPVQSRTVAIPTDVRLALQQYVSTVRPVSYMLTEGHKVDTWRTYGVELEQVKGETIASSYHKISRTMMTGPVRGRTSAATVRNAIYEAIDSCDISVRLRFVRYLELAKSECLIHLSLTKVPDSVIHQLALRFSDVGVTIRERIAMEANRRGVTMEEWWGDILAQAPDSYAYLEDSDFGWAKIAMWMLFHTPTDRWDKLKTAMKAKALSAAARDSVGGICLPAKKGSVERLTTAVTTGVRAISKSFMGYYQGVADVAYAVSRAALEINKTRTAELLKEGAHLWSLRARALRSINVSTVAHDEPLASKNHIRVAAEPVDVVLKPAPYMAYSAWREHVKNSDLVSTAVKKHIADIEQMIRVESQRKSSVFEHMERPIIPCKDSTVTRYLNDPVRLGTDMERSWGLLVGDVKEIINKFVLDSVPPVPARVKQKDVVIINPINLDDPPAKRPKYEMVELGPKGLPLRDYWEVFGEAGQDVAMGIEDDVEKLPEGLMLQFYEGQFEDVSHILEVLDRIKAEISAPSRVGGETVG